MLKIFLKNNIKILISLFVLLFLIFSYTHAGNMLLENYSGLTKNLTGDITSDNPELAIASYINMLVKIAFGLASVGAVILIIWGGVTYAGSSYLKKDEGKRKIQNALIAILILVGSFMVFQKVNPDALKVRFNLAKPIAADRLSEIQRTNTLSLDYDTAFEMVKHGWKFQKIDNIEAKPTWKNANKCNSSDEINKYNEKGSLYDNKCRCWFVKPDSLTNFKKSFNPINTFNKYSFDLESLSKGSAWYIIYRPYENTKEVYYFKDDGNKKAKKQCEDFMGRRQKMWNEEYPGDTANREEVFAKMECKKTTIKMKLLEKIGIIPKDSKYFFTTFDPIIKCQK